MWVTASMAQQQCDCMSNFNFMVEKIKNNYVGYADKVTAANNKEFTHFTDSCKKVAATGDQHTCLQVMRTWLRFFKDYHTSVSINSDPSNYNTIRSIFANTEKVPLSEKQFRAYLDKNAGKLDPIEGIWEEEYHSYRVGFIRDVKKPGKEFAGFILKADSIFWMPGQVKARVQKSKNSYKMVYFLNRDHASFKPSITLNAKSFNAGNFGTWYKVFPQKDSAAINFAARGGPSFRVIDSRNCLLVLPSFHLEYKDDIDSLIAANQNIIKSTDNLIVDLRNNGGGSVLCYEKLMPFIYTNPIISEGASVLATADNVKSVYDTDYPNISDSMKAVFKKEEAELRAHLGQLYNLWPADTLRMDTVYPYPRHVSVIMNENSASSAEMFVLSARQSSKVKLYGQHSMGAVDYSDAAISDMPCNQYLLRYSTSKTNRLPKQVIDYVGIQPDVVIPDTVTDWVKYVQL
jgi:hypothetical protein